MTLDEFRATLTASAPPPEMDGPLAALWWMGRGDWDRAHERAQAGEDADSALVHAHLHRVEGDLSNAGYWYRRAGRPMPEDGLEHEWAALVAELLRRS
jgi:hypothetical protein